jgi:hypothetical protein
MAVVPVVLVMVLHEAQLSRFVETWIWYTFPTSPWRVNEKVPGPEVADTTSVGELVSAVIVSAAVSFEVEKAVLPPLLVAATVLPAVPLVWSHARNVMALEIVPW